MKPPTCFGNFRSLELLLVLFLTQPWVNFWEFGVEANFNFYLDRREFQKLHGISSDIYYVREGVVNKYATSFLVTVPAEVDDLNFSWQSLTKRPVFYEMTIDYTDFFALLTPICNITNSGRLPQNLEVFRVSLPCSGRSNAEVSVTIRITFTIKHPKLNSTTINIKRNKICLLKEPSLKVIDENIPAFPDVIRDGTNSGQSETSPSPSGTSFFQDPTPSLLLAGLLGGCAVTASAVFLTFFICLRRKLTPIPLAESGRILPAYASCHDESEAGGSNNSSPACLLRQGAPGNGQSTDPTLHNQSWKQFNAPDKCGSDILPRSGSHNSYITIASFWNDIFNPANPNASPSVRLGTQHPGEAKGSKCPKVMGSHIPTVKGSDVSPYAYAHVIPKSPLPPPLPKVGAPPLIEWYSQFPCQISNHSPTDKGHIYSNNLHTFCPPKIKYGGSSGRNSGEYEPEGDTRSEPQKTSTIKSGTGSLIQIGGFQCRRNLTKEENVVERFL